MTIIRKTEDKVKRKKRECDGSLCTIKTYQTFVIVYNTAMALFRIKGNKHKFFIKDFINFAYKCYGYKLSSRTVSRYLRMLDQDFHILHRIFHKKTREATTYIVDEKLIGTKITEDGSIDYTDNRLARERYLKKQEETKESRIQRYKKSHPEPEKPTRTKRPIRTKTRTKVVKDKDKKGRRAKRFDRKRKMAPQLTTLNDLLAVSKPKHYFILDEKTQLKSLWDKSQYPEHKYPQITEQDRINSLQNQCAFDGYSEFELSENIQLKKKMFPKAGVIKSPIAFMRFKTPSQKLGGLQYTTLSTKYLVIDRDKRVQGEKGATPLRPPEPEPISRDLLEKLPLDERRRARFSHTAKQDFTLAMNRVMRKIDERKSRGLSIAYVLADMIEDELEIITYQKETHVQSQEDQIHRGKAYQGVGAYHSSNRGRAEASRTNHVG